MLRRARRSRLRWMCERLLIDALHERRIHNLSEHGSKNSFAQLIDLIGARSEAVRIRETHSRPETLLHIPIIPNARHSESCNYNAVVKHAKINAAAAVKSDPDRVIVWAGIQRVKCAQRLNSAAPTPVFHAALS